jgi:hypothetical protein
MCHCLLVMTTMAEGPCCKRNRVEGCLKRAAELAVAAERAVDVFRFIQGRRPRPLNLALGGLHT